MTIEKTRVLTADQVELKIQRIAWELFEKHVNEKEVVFVGISKSGFWLAKKIIAILSDISELQLSLVEMEIYKQNPHAKAIIFHPENLNLKGKNVVLIDDVLNSGKVLIYGIRELLAQPLKRLTTAVLIDRNHKKYPIKADVKGLSLSTSLQEHVLVEINDQRAEVFLN